MNDATAISPDSRNLLSSVSEWKKAAAFGVKVFTRANPGSAFCSVPPASQLRSTTNFPWPYAAVGSPSFPLRSGDHRSFQVRIPPDTAALLYTTPKKNLYHPTYSGLTRLVGRYCALDSSEAESGSLSPSFAARSAGMGLVA